MDQERALPPTFDKSTIKKILVIQLGPFGDGLLTTGYFETLKKSFPGAELHYLIKEPYHLSAVRHPFVDKLITIPDSPGLPGYLAGRFRTIKRLRAEHYDLLIDSQNKPSSQYLTLLSGARLRLGYNTRRNRWVYNLQAPRGGKRYTAARRFDILRPLGIEEEPFQLYFPIPQESQDYVDHWLESEGLQYHQFAVFSPGSRQARKKWRTDYYAVVADRMQTELGLPIVLLWAPAERGDVEMMSSLMKTRPIIAPPTSLDQATALLKRCRILLCNDSGLNHMAVTTHTTTLAIFGPMNPLRWSPASVFSHHHHLHVPGGSASGDNTFGITPDMAFNKVLEILED